MLQIGTLVKVTENTLAGTCLPSWVGRVKEIYSNTVEVSNGNNRERFVSKGEVEEVRELLPLR